ncbi:MAG: beta-glucosidase [Rubrivivax sp.]|nr:beta-glucosidase [Rubrivivax sp.]
MPDTDPTALRRSDFPNAFRWGCSTASYQIEGATDEDGRGESIWDRFCTRPGAIRDGSSGAVACDHYHRWPEDLDLARSLGVDAYRFSIAWPRVLPEGRGRVEPRGLDFYSRLVDGMLERGLEPWATLYHWDLPQALQDQGGWMRRETLDAFADYADLVTRRLGDRVKHWITHNEPWVTAWLGHGYGVHAPGQANAATALQVCHHLLVSHGMLVPRIRANVSDARVGIVLSLHPQIPASDSAEDAAAAHRHDGLRNRWFLDPLHGRGYPDDAWRLLGPLAPQVRDGDMATIAAATDFLGINYYFPEVVKHAPGAGLDSWQLVDRPGVERTAFGWEVSPQGLVDLFERVHREWAPGPLVITENGSTWDDRLEPDGRVHDAERTSYLARHLQAVQRLVQRGVPVQGYFAWSLIDNFEWAEGYTRRFGLTYVDYATQQRHLKDSGRWYARFLRP